MSEARAITNTIGNAVATMAIAKWVGAVDEERMQRVLNGESSAEELRALYDVDDAPEHTRARRRHWRGIQRSGQRGRADRDKASA
jgi:aerobic C4-dicarboxylate transport protein